MTAIEETANINTRKQIVRLIKMFLLMAPLLLNFMPPFKRDYHHFYEKE